MSSSFTALPTANTISATNDWLAIDTTSLATTQKINRNTLLGITGSPVGDTDTQTLTNKTVGNTNTVTLKDTLFTLQDDGDTTKQAKFQLSGITTATTRTYTLPNASSTLADIATAQTFTNKTLTSPVITGGSIDNSTITVDSISGHTSGTIVSVAGVQMNNGTIGTPNAVTTTAIADSAVTPAKLQTGTGASWVYQSYSPTLTNLTLGNGTSVGTWSQIGKTVFVRYKFTFGNSGSAMGTNPQITLPVTARADYVSNDVVGQGYATVAGANQYDIMVGIVSTTTWRPFVWLASGTYVSNITSITAAIPAAWQAADIFQVQFNYEAA